MMNPSIVSKLESLLERHEELQHMLSDAEVISVQEKFRNFSKEYSELEPVVLCFRQLQQAKSNMAEAELLQKDSDADLRAMAADEIASSSKRIESLESELQKLLLPKDPRDGCNVFLEIRAGTGGDEAAIFSGDLFRMYSRYAESKRWKLEILSERRGEHGGYKEVITRVEGDNVYGQLKFESGAHRVQRVPETEAQGRVHTSACTVAVMAELAEQAEIELNKSELRIDTYRASGAGGQHVNKTESAVRITHLPTNSVVSSQNQRSQMQNRETAERMLRGKLIELKIRAREDELARVRGETISAGWGNQIRSYVLHPYQMVKDHRTGHQTSDTVGVLDGDFDAFVLAELERVSTGAPLAGGSVDEE